MKRIITALLVLLLSAVNLSAIGFGYNIFEIRTTPEFGKGIFPTSLLYQFNFPIPGDSTTVAFRLDNGLVYRTLRQSPDDGYLYARNPYYRNEFSAGETRDYSVQFDEWNLVFGQGFLRNRFPDDFIFTIWGTVDGRFENAFERLSWLTDTNNVSGVFYALPGVSRFPADTSWVGAPELAGNRSVFQLSLSAGLDINFMQDSITRRNGIKLSTWFRITPSWLQLFGDSADFKLLWTKLDLALTLFSVHQTGERDTTYLSLVFDNSTTYRYLSGTKVPSYVQGGEIWGTQAPNTQHVITNRSSLTLYGPQINSYDCYPSISAFIDIGYSRGAVLNSSLNESLSEFIGSYGIRAEFVIFNIFEAYYEFGHVFNAVLNENRYSKHSFGFSIGI